VKVINKDGASVTTKMVVKQLHYIPITPRLKTVVPMQRNGTTNEVAQGKDT
jgi:hypothetical protein